MIDLKDRRLNTFAVMKNMFMMYYMNAKMEELNPERTKKIAWITSGGPVEPLYAMDVIPIYPENHGALIGTAKQGTMLAEVAERQGFSPDLCSYARCDFGQIETGQSPIGGLPKPDFLVACNNICLTVIKWYEELARRFKVPLIIIDTPFVYDELDDAAVGYVRFQMQAYIQKLETICGRKMDPARLMEVCSLSRDAVEGWKRVLRQCQHKPAPMSCFDAFTHMAPIVTMRGTQDCVDYYKTLEAELIERTGRDFGAIPEEKHRVLWDNLPVWFEMNWLSTTLAERKTCMVADTYTNAWADNDLDFTEPVAGLARVYASIYLNLNMKQMIEKIARLADLYAVDGLVMHSNRSCKPYSFGQYDMQRLLRDRLQRPVMLLDADMVDPRQYDREQTLHRLDAFLALL